MHRHHPDHFLRSEAKFSSYETITRDPTLSHVAHAMVFFVYFNIRLHPSSQNIPLTCLCQHLPICHTLGPMLPHCRHCPLLQVISSECRCSNAYELACMACNLEGCQGCTVGRVSVFGASSSLILRLHSINCSSQNVLSGMISSFFIQCQIAIFK